MNRRTVRELLGLASAVALLALSGCGTEAASTASSSGGKEAVNGSAVVWPQASYKGASQATVTLPTLGVTLAAPGPDAAKRLTLTADQAYAHCATDLACPVMATGPSIMLSRITTTNGGALPASGGGVPSTVSGLAYVLQWRGVPCIASAVPGKAAPKPTTCLWIALVDATTGRSLGSGQTNVPTG